MYKVTDTSVKYNVAAEVSESGDGSTVIGDYEIAEELGHGSFGTVHLVKNKLTGKLFAMKEYNKANLRKRQQTGLMQGGRGGMPMRPGRGGLFAARRMMLQRQNSEEEADPFYLIKPELAISKKLRHPNIVRLYEVLNDAESEVLYLVIDLCRKGPVQELNSTDEKTTPLPIEKARKYFTHALLALEYLHKHGIIHRDIKTDNMLLTDDDVLKVADFGESVMPSDGGNKVTGATGTPAFMAPELCQGVEEISGEAADIWSLGVCLYGFVFGTLPFKGFSTIEIMDSISSGKLDFPGPHDEQLQDLLLHMLERNPEARITIPVIRKHPWVTQDGAYELPSEEENCKHVVGPITQEDLDNVLKPIFDIMPVINAITKIRAFRQRIREKREAEQQNSKAAQEEEEGSSSTT
ncbi:hypothetical protein H4217_001919 [Coemansia sp. RSA 1939]|nr:hypothetical protein H4217_001919 [Coemansia sp. RSA 1939]KAJ2613618.1 hypothetical protein EV177_002461 [Coemansia sp. RSA 1804]KAJ2681358.1 hypothetical protein GGH99_005250 [Coemansia sp. RSA 1285]